MDIRQPIFPLTFDFRPAASKVIIVNDSFARHYFPAQDPLGKTITFDSKRTGTQNDREIIGVVADIRDVFLVEPPRPQFFTPLLQRSKTASLHLYARTRSDDPAQLASALQQAVWAVDKDIPISHIQSLAATISQSAAGLRFRTWLLSAFPIAGLALTLIGIYGVISYSVGQRTQEIGIRVALGAPRDNVLRLILGQGLKLALLGVAVGLVSALGLTRLIASELFGVKPSDPATLVATAALMVAVACTASYLPARRATRVDPVTALRRE